MYYTYLIWLRVDPNQSFVSSSWWKSLLFNPGRCSYSCTGKSENCLVNVYACVYLHLCTSTVKAYAHHTRQMHLHLSSFAQERTSPNTS